MWITARIVFFPFTIFICVREIQIIWSEALIYCNARKSCGCKIKAEKVEVKWTFLEQKDEILHPPEMWWALPIFSCKSEFPSERFFF